MSLFSKSSPVQRFNANYFELKLKAYKMMLVLRGLVEKQIGHMSEHEYNVLSARYIDYLLGEDHPTPGPKSSPETIEIYKAAYERAPKIAGKLADLTALNSYIAALIDYKNNKLTELLGDEWTGSDEGKRVYELIRNTDADIENTPEYKSYLENMNTLV